MSGPGGGIRISGQAVLVIGAGTTGAAVTRALLDAGAHVTVADTQDTPEVASRAGDLERLGARVVLGWNETTQLGPVDLVVPSPGVPEISAALQAVARRAPVWSEPELAWRLAEGRTRLVAVTGTNGKTTTTELVAACLDIPAAGNIGTPLIEVLTRADPPDLVAAELSSFQLRYCSTLRPDVAVLLNLAPDHLDWHGSVEAYAAAKARVWANQRADDVAVVNADDAGARSLAAASPPPGRVVDFTTGEPGEGQVGVRRGVITARLGEPVEVVALDALHLSGPHNVANVTAAVAAAASAGADLRGLADPLRRYRPGRHRLELVATVAGVNYIDDSKATNPHAAAAALAAQAPRDGEPVVVWIAGGLGKGLEFGSLEPYVAASVRAAVTIGTSGPAIAELVRRAGKPVTEAADMGAAVRAAASYARPGDTVLLAPACASMDQFRNYAERGEVFRAHVAELEVSDV